MKNKRVAAIGDAAMLDVKGAASLLGMTEKGLRRQVERRRVPYRRLGRKLVFIRSEIEAWIYGLPGAKLEEIIFDRERSHG